MKEASEHTRNSEDSMYLDYVDVFRFLWSSRFYALTGSIGGLIAGVCMAVLAHLFIFEEDVPVQIVLEQNSATTLEKVVADVNGLLADKSFSDELWSSLSSEPNTNIKPFLPSFRTSLVRFFANQTTSPSLQNLPSLHLDYDNMSERVSLHLFLCSTDSTPKFDFLQFLTTFNKALERHRDHRLNSYKRSLEDARHSLQDHLHRYQDVVTQKLSEEYEFKTEQLRHLKTLKHMKVTQTELSLENLTDQVLKIVADQQRPGVELSPKEIFELKQLASINAALEAIGHSFRRPLEKLRNSILSESLVLAQLLERGPPAISHLKAISTGEYEEVKLERQKVSLSLASFLYAMAGAWIGLCLYGAIELGKQVRAELKKKL